MDDYKIKITEYEVLGNLPDPFMKKDGTRISSPAEWNDRKKEMYADVIELQYGTMPPQPEFLEVKQICQGRESKTYRITTGKKSHPVLFYMRVFFPKAKGIFPAVVDGDMGFDYFIDNDFRDAFVKENILLVMFNRTELADDIQHEGRRHGPLYDAYPEYTFGALGAWAWGYSRCVDALEKLGIADMNHIAFTGHSRGGKTAALAGALDERAEIVNPNATCAGSSSCYRIHMKAITEYGSEVRSERLSDLMQNFDFWMGEGMRPYAQQEENLPFDCHMLKAMIAPRTMFASEAVSDIWSNPVGAWMTSLSAGEVFDFLGVPENNLWYFRDGDHYHSVEDASMLVNIIKNKTEGRPLNDRFFRRPFEAKEPIYDWKQPGK